MTTMTTTMSSNSTSLSTSTSTRTDRLWTADSLKRVAHRGGMRQQQGLTPDERSSLRTAVAETVVNEDNLKRPTIPLLYHRDEDGKWTATVPRSANARQSGGMKARTTLGIKKLTQIDRMRATLAKKKNA